MGNYVTSVMQEARPGSVLLRVYFFSDAMVMPMTAAIAITTIMLVKMLIRVSFR